MDVMAVSFVASDCESNDKDEFDLCVLIWSPSSGSSWLRELFADAALHFRGMEKGFPRLVGVSGGSMTSLAAEHHCVISF